jgi:hypothetical protein
LNLCKAGEGYLCHIPALCSAFPCPGRQVQWGEGREVSG